MLDNLIYSLNATAPVFLVMLAGYILRQTGWVNENFVNVANKINFRLTLPALLLQDLMACDIRKVFDVKFVLYCAIVTSICFWGIWGLSRLFVKNKSIRGAFVQASFRGSVAVLGIAMIVNIYGEASLMPLVLIGAVPLYNIYSVIVLMMESNEEKGKSAKDVAKGIFTNPIILAIAAGMILSIFHVKFPTMVANTIGNFAKMATPLALLALGAGFEGASAIAKLKPTIVASSIKLLIQPVLFLPFAVWLGFRDAELLAILIMLGSPTTPSCYIMAKNMGNDGVLTSSIVVLTTVMSAFTITGLLFVLKTMGFV